MSREKAIYNLTCPSCGKTGKGTWEQPAFEESYYLCECGSWWHPELLEAESPAREFTDKNLYSIAQAIQRRINKLEEIFEGYQKAGSTTVSMMQSKIDRLEAELKAKDKQTRPKSLLFGDLDSFTVIINEELVPENQIWFASREQLEKALEYSQNQIKQALKGASDGKVKAENNK